MSLPVRVLVVDDAVIVRRIITQALTEQGGIEVVGAAAGGAVALERIEALRPDVVTLDLDMPDMDGVTTLKAIRQRWPVLPVLIFSGANDQAQQVEALAAGANATVPKLPHEGNMRNSLAWVRDQLAPAIRNLPRTNRSSPVEETRSPAPTDAISVRPGRAKRPAVLGIGASTGGPDALERFLSRLSSDFPLPILIVQHMPEGFTRLLAQRLSDKSGFPAAEARPGVPLVAGQILVAPGDRHLVVERTAEGPRAQITQAAPENSVRPSVDVLFRSLAQVFGESTLAVVLTGMGQDGLAGTERICQAGGRVLVQDEASSVVWGMPGAIARAGLAEGILPLDQLAQVVNERVRGERVAPVRS